MEKKVWGEYTTYKNPERIGNLHEEDIWKKISNLSSFLRQISMNPSNLYSKEQITNSKYNLAYLVYLTRKFGVVFDTIPSETVKVENSDSFKSWYKFWHEHFENMTPEEYEEFIEAKNEGKDVTVFLPTKSWFEANRTK